MEDYLNLNIYIFVCGVNFQMIRSSKCFIFLVLKKKSKTFPRKEEEYQLVCETKILGSSKKIFINYESMTIFVTCIWLGKKKSTLILLLVSLFTNYVGNEETLWFV